MRRTCSLLALCFAWLCANGALWNCVQVFAWAKMLHDYSRIMAWQTAVEKTFDGSMPCEMCMMVDRAQHEQDQSPPAQMIERDTAKVLLALQEAEPVVIPTPEFGWPDTMNRIGPERIDPVEVPPPRV